tara:strand:- start:3056 stop:3799 length:744 start_codon:yes stop_codon:yes gene_type:complete
MSDMPSLGSWITIGHPAVAEIMAAAGFDWLTVDLEHSAISIERAEEIIRIIELCGVKPFVRLSSHNPEQIKRVMDSGAHGIIVPMVKTAEEVTRAVAAVHYPPLGNRSVGLARAQKYGNDFEAYYDWQKSNVMVIVQIEHIDAVDNIEEIFSIQGISGYIVGPYDLSASMGIPGDFANEKMSVALERIKIAAKDYQVPSGIHIVEPDLRELKQRISEGYRFIAYGVDMRMLDITCRLATDQMEDQLS